MRFLLLTFALCLSAGAADSVALTQKGNAVTITIQFDCTMNLDSFTKQIADTESARATSLARKLTADQIAAENAKYDAQIASIKRATQLQFFECAKKILNGAQDRAAISDADAAAAIVAAKAKIDADAAKQDALKPIVDADISK